MDGGAPPKRNEICGVQLGVFVGKRAAGVCAGWGASTMCVTPTLSHTLYACCCPHYTTLHYVQVERLEWLLQKVQGDYSYFDALQKRFEQQQSNNGGGSRGGY